MSVCLSARLYLEPHIQSLPIFVLVAYSRGSVLLRHVDDRSHRLSAGRGDGSAQRGRSVIRLPCYTSARLHGAEYLTRVLAHYSEVRARVRVRVSRFGAGLSEQRTAIITR